MKFKTLRLTEIADVDRVKKDTVLPKGTLYIRVSACKGAKYEQWNIMKEDGNPGDGFAALTLKRQAIPEYLKETLELSAPQFMQRYVGKSINISMDLFKFYKVNFHDNIDDQRAIVNVMNSINNEIVLTEQQIKQEKENKKWFLDNMFPSD